MNAQDAGMWLSDRKNIAIVDAWIDAAPPYKENDYVSGQLFRSSHTPQFMEYPHNLSPDAMRAIIQNMQACAKRQAQEELMMELRMALVFGQKPPGEFADIYFDGFVKLADRLPTDADKVRIIGGIRKEPTIEWRDRECAFAFAWIDHIEIQT